MTDLASLPESVRAALRDEPVPDWRAPMLATLTEKRFSDPKWIFERKFDGMRCLAFRDGDRIVLLSRNRKQLNGTYPELVDALAAQHTSRFVVDGEVVAFDGRRTSFERLQGRLGITDPEVARASEVRVFYYVFDLLHLDGESTVDVPLCGVNVYCAPRSGVRPLCRDSLAASARKAFCNRLSTIQCPTGRGITVDKEGGTLVHAVAERPEALVWLANQSCIALYIWQSRRGRQHNPDRLVFDLDPSGDEFAVVRATARATAAVLDDLGLACYLQTTGSRGLHVVVPLRGDSDFDTARQFARDVAEVIVADDPDHRTLEARKDNRGDRVYLDVMRNGYAQTAIAPYSVRARAGAPVATPLQWDELSGRGLRADRFTLRDIPKRLGAQGDPWSDMSLHPRALTGPLRRLAKLRA